MLARLIGLLICSLLATSVHAADGNKEVFSPWSAAPSCVAGRSCVYLLASDGQLYVVDASGVTTKMQAAKSFRTSANCAGLASPANGDVCYDTALGVHRVYAGGWKTLLAASGGAVVYQSVTGGAAGTLGIATLYLRSPGQAGSGSVEQILTVATRASYARNLRCFASIAPVSSNTVIITTHSNYSATVLTCTITSASQNCSNTGSTIALTAGDKLSIEAVSDGALASDLTCSFEVTN